MLGCTWSTPRLIAESNFIWTEKYKTSPERVNCIDFSTSRKVNTIETAQVVGAKRSTHTVYVANMGGGDRYLYG